MDRRVFLANIALTAATVATGPMAASVSHPSRTARKPREKPNIIWIVAEDICPDLACYGSRYVKTPNIDRLAAQGVRYNNAFATSPVCSPSRSAFFTGMYQTSIGAYHHRSHMEDGYRLPQGVRLLSDYLRQAGYFTMMMGPKQKTDFNFTPDGPVFDAIDGEQSSAMGAYTHAPVDMKIFEGPAWKAYPGDRPFFAQINFSEAHRTFAKDPHDPIDPDSVYIPPYYPDHPIVRRDWASYLETVQLLDKKVGNLMKEIRDKKLDKNTVIIFFGDHGRAMLRGKQWLYEGGIHVPLIVWWPGRVKAGTVSSDLVSLIDLCPTTMRIAGVDIPGNMQGKVFFGDGATKSKYIFAARDRCDEVDDRIRCVRSKRHKYIRNFYPQRPYTRFSAYKKLQYPVMTLMEVLYDQGKLTPQQAQFMAPTRPVEELYDLKNDPYELNNLAKDPAHEPILLEMRTALDEWICRTKDKAQLPEDAEISKYWDNFFKKRYAEVMKERGLSAKTSNRDYLKWWTDNLELPPDQEDL